MSDDARHWTVTQVLEADLSDYQRQLDERRAFAIFGRHSASPERLAGWVGSWPPPARCPECVAGKHGNCDGTTWDEAADAPGSCPCADAGHTP